MKSGMRTMIAISVLITMRLVASAAADPAITDASGQWFCQPDDPHHPQIQIDFVEAAYRRCDQHIYLIYALSPVEAFGDDIRITFGDIGVLNAPSDGTRYTETVTIGGTSVVSRGGCEFRSLDDLYLENPQVPERARL
jgi:hypothetical protein